MTMDLINSLRDSGLYSPEEIASFEEELKGIAGGSQEQMQALIERERITAYQLRKVVNGRSADLLIGPYVVQDKLGEGGMGKVFRALHKHDGREVALKVVREHLLAKPTARGRYEREVQTALTLSHPNIIHVASAGSTDGRYFIEMEFIDGLDLSRIVQRYGVLPISEACEYARQAALGLHHAHELGFVHRDVKPSNIMVGGSRHIPAAKEPAWVKVLDMGLVRMIGYDDEERGLTRDGTVVGTPDYMAPEQAKNSRVVDGRADLYSLGATFYFMLSGKPPFPDGTALDKIIRHVDHLPPPLESLRPDAPRELVQIVDRLMAKNPDQRFDTALDLAEALKPLTYFATDRLASEEYAKKLSGTILQPADMETLAATDATESVQEGAGEKLALGGWRSWSSGTVVGIVIVTILALIILALVARVAFG